jgi:hypothetical protein
MSGHVSNEKVKPIALLPVIAFAIKKNEKVKTARKNLKARFLCHFRFRLLRCRFCEAAGNDNDDNGG